MAPYGTARTRRNTRHLSRSKRSAMLNGVLMTTIANESSPASPASEAPKIDAGKLAIVPKPKAGLKPLLLKIVMTVLPPLLGILLFIGVWAIVAKTSPNLPGPGKTWVSAVQVFSDPF